jgi:AraC family transcriptional regulator
MDANLTLDLGALSERLAMRIDADMVATPRVRFSDDRIWTLVKLLADVVDDPDPSTQLYGDGLTAAIVARLFSSPPDAAADQRGQAPCRVVQFSI